MEVLALARQGTIRAHVQRFPLSQVADVYQQLREGEIDGRAVIAPAEPEDGARSQLPCSSSTCSRHHRQAGEPCLGQIIEPVAALVRAGRDRDDWLVIYGNEVRKPGDFQLAHFGEHVMAADRPGCARRSGLAIYRHLREHVRAGRVVQASRRR
jgi:hypothetical protein